jgi:hypothetical protein
LCKKRKTKEDKQKVIEYAPKKKDPSGAVDVWRNMTVLELSVSTKRNLEEVQEAMLYIKDGPDIHPKTRLEDLNVIKDIIKVSPGPFLKPKNHKNEF